MKFARLMRHVLALPWSHRRYFDAAALTTIESAIAESEARHGGEIMFAVEATLSPIAVLQGVTPRARALEWFARCGVWDTEANNGVLIYLLLADHDVEIVADRGFNGKVQPQEWAAVCHEMEQAFAGGAYVDGVVKGVQAVGELIRRHYPATDRNELPNKPLVV
jgi:uncharacterized membrane protein